MFFISRTTLGHRLSEGARLLRQTLIERKLTQLETERLLGIPRGMLNKWLHCKQAPGIEFAVRIEQMLGIPVESWVQKPTVPIMPHRVRMPKKECCDGCS